MEEAFGNHCLWCSGSSLETSSKLYAFLTSKPSAAASKRQFSWITQANQDLSTCVDCMKEYHLAVKNAFVNDRRFSENRHQTMKLAYEKNITRLQDYLAASLEVLDNASGSGEDEDDIFFMATQRSEDVKKKLECSLIEIVQHPRFLLNAKVNDLFVRGVAAFCDANQPIENTAKFPGIYLLLVHPNEMVRRWAMECAQALGPLDWDDFDDVEEVIGWIMNVLTFDLFQDPITDVGDAVWNEDLPVQLPRHLFDQGSQRDYWHGVYTLISSMDSNCIRMRLVCATNDHNQLINLISSALEHSGCTVPSVTAVGSCRVTAQQASMSVFVPALQCLKVLLEQLGSRFWQYSVKDSEALLRAILSNPYLHYELGKWLQNPPLPSPTMAKTAKVFKSEHSSDGTDSQIAYETSRKASEEEVSGNDSSGLLSSALAWVAPLVHSLLDFGDLMADTVTVLLKWLNSVYTSVLAGNCTFDLPSYVHFTSLSACGIKTLSASPLANELLFRISQIVELLYVKEAAAFLLNCKDHWLPLITSVISTACEKRVLHKLSSVLHVISLLISILSSALSKQLPNSEDLCSSFTLMHECIQNGKPVVKKIPKNELSKHVTILLSKHQTLQASLFSPSTAHTCDQGQELNLQTLSSDDGAIGGSSDSSCHEKNDDVASKKEALHSIISKLRKRTIAANPPPPSSSTPESPGSGIRKLLLSHSKKKKFQSSQQQPNTAGCSFENTSNNCPSVDDSMLSYMDTSESDFIPLSQGLPIKRFSLSLSKSKKRMLRSSESTDELAVTEQISDQSVVGKPSRTTDKKLLKLKKKRLAVSSGESTDECTPSKKNSSSCLSTNTQDSTKAKILKQVNSLNMDNLLSTSKRTRNDLKKKSLVELSSAPLTSASKPPKKKRKITYKSSSFSSSDDSDFEPVLITYTPRSRQVQTARKHTSVTMSKTSPHLSPRSSKPDSKPPKSQSPLPSREPAPAQPAQAPPRKSFSARKLHFETSSKEQLTPLSSSDRVIEQEEIASRVVDELMTPFDDKETGDLKTGQLDKDTSGSDTTLPKSDSDDSDGSMIDVTTIVERPTIQLDQPTPKVLVISSDSTADSDSSCSGPAFTLPQSKKSKPIDIFSESHSSSSLSQIFPSLHQPDKTTKDGALQKTPFSRIYSKHERSKSPEAAVVVTLDTETSSVANDTKKDGEGLSKPSTSSRRSLQLLVSFPTSRKQYRLPLSMQHVRRHTFPKDCSVAVMKCDDVALQELKPKKMSNSGSTNEMESKRPTATETGARTKMSSLPAVSKHLDTGTSSEISTSQKAQSDCIPSSRKPLVSARHSKTTVESTAGKKQSTVLVKTPGMDYRGRKSFLEKTALATVKDTQYKSSVPPSSLRLVDPSKCRIPKKSPEPKLTTTKGNATVPEKAIESKCVEARQQLTPTSMTLPTSAEQNRQTQHLPSPVVQLQASDLNRHKPSHFDSRLKYSLNLPTSPSSEGRHSSSTTQAAMHGRSAVRKRPPNIDIFPKRQRNMDDLFLAVLRWNPAEHLFPETLVNGRVIAPKLPLQAEPKHIPLTFCSYEEYLEVFTPLLLLEAWECVFADIHSPSAPKPPPCKATLDSLTPSQNPRIQHLRCTALITHRQAREYAYPSEHDLVILNFGSSNLFASAMYNSIGVGGSGQHIFALVDLKPRVQMGASSTEKCKLTLQLKVCGFHAVSAGNSTVEISVASSIKTVVRQWNGLINIHRSQLARDILYPRGGPYFGLGCNPAASASSLDSPSGKEMDLKYSHSQMDAIRSISRAVCRANFAIPRICLLQGPPGTGKTRTVFGLIEELFKVLHPANKSATTAPLLPGQNQQQMTTRTRTAAAAAAAGGGAATLQASQPHILVCAPSNAGVDEIARRLLRQKGKKSGHRGAFKGVRVGQSERIHPDILPISLDELVRKNLARSRIAEQDSAKTSAELQKKIEAVSDAIERGRKEMKLLRPRETPFDPATRDQITKIERDLAMKHRKLEELHKQRRMIREKRRATDHEDAKVRKRILMDADIVCTTLQGCGSSVLSECRSRTPPHFTCIIVDEACQCTELDMLIPLCFPCSKLVLVGDPMQLPATVKSQRAIALSFKQSLFERIFNFFSESTNPAENPVRVLTTQYRMLPEICQFPSSHFYKGKLDTASSVVRTGADVKFKPFMLFDVKQGTESFGRDSSLCNIKECELLLELLKHLINRFNVSARDIGVITPYKAQEKLIRKELRRRPDLKALPIDIGTVDSFQGREKAVIVLSCVRANSNSGTIGFLSSPQRMNVALTRAKLAVYILAHVESIRVSNDWHALVNFAERHIAVTSVTNNYSEAVKAVDKPITTSAQRTATTLANKNPTRATNNPSIESPASASAHSHRALQISQQRHPHHSSQLPLPPSPNHGSRLFHLEQASEHAHSTGLPSSHSYHHRSTRVPQTQSELTCAKNTSSTFNAALPQHLHTPRIVQANCGASSHPTASSPQYDSAVNGFAACTRRDREAPDPKMTIGSPLRDSNIMGQFTTTAEHNRPPGLSADLQISSHLPQRPATSHPPPPPPPHSSHEEEPEPKRIKTYSRLCDPRIAKRSATVSGNHSGVGNEANPKRIEKYPPPSDPRIRKKRSTSTAQKDNIPSRTTSEDTSHIHDDPAAYSPISSSSSSSPDPQGLEQSSASCMAQVDHRESAHKLENTWTAQSGQKKRTAHAPASTIRTLRTSTGCDPCGIAKSADHTQQKRKRKSSRSSFFSRKKGN